MCIICVCRMCVSYMCIIYLYVYHVSVTVDNFDFESDGMGHQPCMSTTSSCVSDYIMEHPYDTHIWYARMTYMDTYYDSTPDIRRSGIMWYTHYEYEYKNVCQSHIYILYDNWHMTSDILWWSFIWSTYMIHTYDLHAYIWLQTYDDHVYDTHNNNNNKYQV